MNRTMRYSAETIINPDCATSKESTEIEQFDSAQNSNCSTPETVEVKKVELCINQRGIKNGLFKLN